MRSIFLRETDDGEWFLGVSASPNVYLSVQMFQASGQAVRAFILEGRQQPFARMLVQVRRGDRPKVVRESHRPSYSASTECVVLAAVKSALLMPHLRAARLRDPPVVATPSGADRKAARSTSLAPAR